MLCCVLPARLLAPGEVRVSPYVGLHLSPMPERFCFEICEALCQPPACVDVAVTALNWPFAPARFQFAQSEIIIALMDTELPAIAIFSSEAQCSIELSKKANFRAAKGFEQPRTLLHACVLEKSNCMLHDSCSSELE